MIKTASKIYKNQYIPPAPKLRRSSGNKNIENYYISKQNIEEYNLYRKQEILVPRNEEGDSEDTV